MHTTKTNTRQWWQSEQYELGRCTEKWFAAHVRHIFPGLRHVSAKQYDLTAPLYDEHGKQLSTLFFDVKFYAEKYRTPGWIEIRSWGKITGILQKARKEQNSSNEVFLVCLHHGHAYVLNAKTIVSDILSGKLEVHNRGFGDNIDSNKQSSYAVLPGGFDNKRYCDVIIPLRPELFKSATKNCDEIIASIIDDQLLGWCNGGTMYVK